MLKCKMAFTSQVCSSRTLIRKGFSFLMGRDSSVGIATRYGLDGPGIEFHLGRDFLHQYRPALVHNQPLTQWVPGLSCG